MRENTDRQRKGKVLNTDIERKHRQTDKGTMTERKRENQKKNRQTNILSVGYFITRMKSKARHLMEEI